MLHDVRKSFSTHHSVWRSVQLRNISLLQSIKSRTKRIIRRSTSTKQYGQNKHPAFPAIYLIGNCLGANTRPSRSEPGGRARLLIDSRTGQAQGRRGFCGPRQRDGQSCVGCVMRLSRILEGESSSILRFFWRLVPSVLLLKARQAARPRTKYLSSLLNLVDSPKIIVTQKMISAKYMRMS